MGILAWIVLGALAGWIASMIVGNNAEQGMIGNIIIGILGALIGGFIMTAIGGEGLSGFSIYSVFVAIGGSVLVLLVKTKVLAR